MAADRRDVVAEERRTDEERWARRVGAPPGEGNPADQAEQRAIEEEVGATYRLLSEADRDQAWADRAAARSDRAEAARNRFSSAADRDAALTDREEAARDRAAGREDREHPAAPEG
jgi:hypothetical protein